MPLWIQQSRPLFSGQMGPKRGTDEGNLLEPSQDALPTRAAPKPRSLDPNSLKVGISFLLKHFAWPVSKLSETTCKTASATPIPGEKKADFQSWWRKKCTQVTSFRGCCWNVFKCYNACLFGWTKEAARKSPRPGKIVKGLKNRCKHFFSLCLIHHNTRIPEKDIKKEMRWPALPARS